MEKWQDPDTFLTWIVIILGVMVMLIGTLITVFYLSYKKILQAKEEEHQTKIAYQRSLLKVSLDAQENERVRIASDLHDNIISKLTIIRLKAAIGSSAGEVDQLLGNAIDESRRISHELSPPLYEEKSLENVLITIIKSWSSFFNIHKRIDVRSEVNVDKNTKLQLVRILQELINNVYKHAKASDIYFTLRVTQKYTILILKDNGFGFNATNAVKGIGLQNVALRADGLGANYKFNSELGKGTRFIMILKNEKNKFSTVR